MRFLANLRATFLLWRAAGWRERGRVRTADARFCHDRADALERAAAELLKGAMR